MPGDTERSLRSNWVQRRWSVFSDRHLVEAAEKGRTGRWAPRLYRIPVVVPVLLVGTTLVAWSVFVLLARLSGFHLTWWRPAVGSVPADSRGDLVRDTLGVLALCGALLAAIYAYRKQRVEESAGYRSDAESLSKRYQDAAEQLGHDNAAVRLAGVYSMARLADDWPEQRQTCVDVLCAYLRMPIRLDPGSSIDESERQVRLAVVSVMERHLAAPTDHYAGPEAEASWSQLRFDFSGAHFHDLTFGRAVFQQPVTFRKSSFTGVCSLATSVAIELQILGT
jgi:membrane protein implicated in regulation of membrane protease activity